MSLVLVVFFLCEGCPLFSTFVHFETDDNENKLWKLVRERTEKILYKRRNVGREIVGKHTQLATLYGQRFEQVCNLIRIGKFCFTKLISWLKQQFFSVDPLKTLNNYKFREITTNCTILEKSSISTCPFQLTIPKCPHFKSHHHTDYIKKWIENKNALPSLKRARVASWTQFIKWGKARAKINSKTVVSTRHGSMWQYEYIRTRWWKLREKNCEISGSKFIFVLRKALRAGVSHMEMELLC